ncbi:MAG: hypothetical protein HFG28_13305 [Eubacterium sp.]|nr:hypothetical protein [Eubacterium sp.]
MKESTEFLILDTIKKHSSIMPLFTAGYSYSKVVEWVRQLEKEGKICYDKMEQRMLSDVGLSRWRIIKKKKNGFTIMPLNSYRVNKIGIDEIYLP